MKLTIERVKKEIKRMDKKLDIDSEAGMAAQMLLSAGQVGTGLNNIAKFMGKPAKEIRKFHNFAKSNGIFQGRKIHANWFKKDGAISFWCDVLTAQGLMNRTPVEKKADA